jgi:CheY-like chemotaxis protein
MTMGRGVCEVRCVQTGTTKKACFGVPTARGRLHAIGESCLQPRSAITFPSYGKRLVRLGGFGTEHECRPSLFRSYDAHDMTDDKPAPQAILIVEDDQLLKLLTVDIVEEAGFVALEAGSADEAVAILESRSDIALLLTDIDMPGSMDGLKLAHAVRNRWPPIKVIVVSGRVRLLEEDLPTHSRFFAKPYSSDAIISEIRSFIGR